MFDKSKFIETFKAETRDHIQKLSLGLIDLEKNPHDRQLLEAMMREAHTVKGSSSMMGYKRIADIAHRMEDGLQRALDDEVVLAKEHCDILFKCLDTIEPLLEDKVTWEAKGILRPYVDSLCKEAEDIFAGTRSLKKSEKKPPQVSGTESKKEKEPVKKEPVILESKARAEKTVIQEDSMRVDLNKLDNIVNLSGEMLISKIRLKELVKELSSKPEIVACPAESVKTAMRELVKVNESIDFLSRQMQDEAMRIRMVPVSYLFNSFPRAMRDLADSKGKKVKFLMEGQDTQLDKAILDQLKEPLMHILRNAIDHGIEEESIRQSNKKDLAGTVKLTASREGSHVIIEVSDDGAGIDNDKVKEQAVKKGLISKDKAGEIANEQVFQILFTPGFSTRQEVTETSGRGVGLDVVRDSMAQLKGMVEVVSERGLGTRFILRLPLTLAITESLLVSAGSETFAIPVDTVIETMRINPEHIKTVESKDAITVRKQILPLVRLTDIFGLPRKGIFEKRYMPVIIVQSVEKKIGLLVDRLLGRQEIVSKPIGHPLKEIKNISGATILGDGRAILILDIPYIIESAEGVIIKQAAAKPKAVKASKKKKSILLAEDVLTTAMLEKNILESVGYSVVIARDGQEALERASQETFDLVITDILMPRMDGFQLTEKLRKDKMYKDVPVIIVTTRESDADKRRGLEAGADAYILKSEFTSEGLLNTIERLIG